MPIEDKIWDDEIERYLPDGRPIFRGSVSPEVHAYIIILSSKGYSDDEITNIVTQFTERKI